METRNKFQQLRAFYKQLMPTMSDEGWAIAESLLTVRTVKKRDFIVKEGYVCNHVSFINYGLARVYHATDDREKILCFFKESSYVADYQSFLTRQPAQTNVQALEDTEVVETNYEGLQKLYREVPEANYLGRVIAEQLFIIMNESAICEIRNNIEQRYNKIIDEQPWLLQRVPQYMIASYLGVTPEALSRVKNRISSKSRLLAQVY